MLWLLDMRPELPECFKQEDRDKYRETVEEWHAWCRGRVFFEQGDRVVVTNDFDGMDGDGREAFRIGKVAEVTMTPTTHPLMHHPGNGGEKMGLVGMEMEAIYGLPPRYALSPILDCELEFEDGQRVAWWSGLYLRPYVENEKGEES